MVGAVDGEKKIGLLVDTMGRVNYGENMIDRKGFSDIYIANQRQMGYDVWTLPLDNLEKLTYKPAEGFDKDKGAMFYKGTFKADSQADCFVRLDNFDKGYVWVNGFNLGRYWKVGPQKTLYLPGCLLKEENETVVLETMGMKKPEITITDKHDLG